MAKLVEGIINVLEQSQEKVVRISSGKYKGSLAKTLSDNKTITLFDEKNTKLSLAETKVTRIKSPQIIIVPGNGCSGNIRTSSMWYGRMEKKLMSEGFEVKLSVMPDAFVARKGIWLPFIIDNLAGGIENLRNSLIIGHSSGAVAAMRLAEEHKIGGIILVAAYSNHFGNSNEKASGYFDDAWNWKAQKANCKSIVQLASEDDPYLDINDQRLVGSKLSGTNCKYIEYPDQSHFFEFTDELCMPVLEAAKSFKVNTDTS